MTFIATSNYQPGLLSKNAHADHARDQGEQGDQNPADRGLFERAPGPIVRKKVESAVQLLSIDE
jgi:hypothetical protein